MNIQKRQGGSIGIVMYAMWLEPFNNSPEDKSATERAQSFYMNWYEANLFRHRTFKGNAFMN